MRVGGAPTRDLSLSNWWKDVCPMQTNWWSDVCSMGDPLAL